MLDCAADLIARDGADALRMSAVAERAGVSIGSLYQYFPDKSALIHGLAERYFEAGRRCIAEGLAPVRTEDGLIEAFSGLVDIYLAMFRQDPAMAQVRAGVLADPALGALEVADVRETGALLADALARVAPTGERARLARHALILMQSGESAMRLALSLPDAEADALIAAYKEMAAAEIRRLCAPT
ncbi:MAG: TetR/AcrR family transcriptional regulator [Marivibrio sp.]